RDYELYVGFVYSKKGYDVNYFGSMMGMEDLGRDLIVSKGETVTIIQCKYWSQEKTIHEKHIMQLYGTVTSYKIENDLPSKKVKGIFITNICLSEMAKKVADYLKIRYIEKFEKKDYPCIKCNIGKDEHGKITKIYHLPFDQQYDSTQIKNEGEFFAMTVKEAEDAGFRRAFKWFGTGD
ncbi:MAG: restriction endonuclease, partial [Clostridia bacterium]|nr:restriction endonuclease [Clostridia bacterium]